MHNITLLWCIYSGSFECHLSVSPTQKKHTTECKLKQITAEQIWKTMKKWQTKKKAESTQMEGSSLLIILWSPALRYDEYVY